MAKIHIEASEIEFDEELNYFVGYNSKGEVLLDEYGFKKEFEPNTKREVYKKNKTIRMKNSLLKKIKECANQKRISDTLLLEILLEDFFKSNKCEKNKAVI